jgi:hypothetical protein
MLLGVLDLACELQIRDLVEDVPAAAPQPGEGVRAEGGGRCGCHYTQVVLNLHGQVPRAQKLHCALLVYEARALENLLIAELHQRQARG